MSPRCQSNVERATCDARALAVPTDAPMVLHVPYTYFPDAPGGTEVYVRSLARNLLPHGFLSKVAAPARNNAAYVQDGIAVHRFAIDPRPGLDLAYGFPDEIAAASFSAIVGQLAPAIVHLHARTSAVSGRLIDIAHAAGAKVVLTYHTPTVSCGRGDMMLFGEVPCDGVVERRRCTECVIRGRAVPESLARLAASIPLPVSNGLAQLVALQGPLAALRLPGLMSSQHERLRRLFAQVDHVVAVCDWVRDLLLRNHVPLEKLTLSRQGIAEPVSSPAGTRPPDVRRARLTIGYFGRTDPTKGPDLLAEALAKIPKADVSVDIFAMRQTESDPHFEKLVAQERNDPRIQIKAALAPEEVHNAMRHYDLVAVPSRWLETGPLVVLEAFSVGVPVIGANRGGIAELVRDGVDGVLVAPGDAAAWGAAIATLCADPDAIAKLRKGVRPPRTMSDAAADMARVYCGLGVTPGTKATLGSLVLPRDEAGC